jgi:hypothetical protein
MSSRRLSSTSFAAITVAIVGVIGTIVTAYFAYLGSITPTELSLGSTRTAQAQIGTASTPNLLTDTLTPDTPVPSKTNTLLPTYTVTAESTPVVLFSDNFNSNAHGWALGVRDGNTINQKREIIEGTLQLNYYFHEDGYGWIYIPDIQAENFYLSVDAVVTQHTTKSKVGIAIFFRIGDRGNTAYAIKFNNDGTLALYLNETINQYGKWELLHQENSDALELKEGVVNNLAIRVLGQRFTAYSNGVELYTFEDNSLRGIGQIAIGINGDRQNTAIMQFDNLLITK